MIILSNGMILNQVEIVAIVPHVPDGWNIHFKCGIYITITPEIKIELEGLLK